MIAPWLHRSSCVLAALALGACAGSAATRYFALEAIAPAAGQAGDAARASAYRGPPIELRSVQIPPTVDRLEMIRELSAGQLALREFDHWAAPLARMARQTLTEDLSHRLPRGSVIFPGAAGPPARAVLTVDVLSFHVLDGTATMVASWSIRWPAPDASAASAAPDGQTAPRFESLRLSAPAGDGASALERAWSELLAQAADRIAADVKAR